ncbi:MULTISPECIES: hypothetical protein [Staphylococcus]|uniref:Uncharacterized protein n=1 Tax=Staphylococcus ureilyticus TaxID=94138 RepID=A0AB34AGJ4_STAUR|nr:MULTISPECIES: hypothetical protein [Staphylococcus]AQM41966.1 hypothetical protein BZ166_11710 [Staphylococcus cohnii]KKD22006.1 hypothetical protein XA22_12645 [Staphylococcus cohnii subsp. cohnii]AVL78360.1 hypothetical protein CEQ12_11545 [Staphylococcus cohnii]KKD25021.1 hypothetical protein XA21_01865 [Staphylococcus cohnii subsp. cohnii]MBM9446638.1 hypothetical protein [Staphylococcus ureilyticus]
MAVSNNKNIKEVVKNLTENVPELFKYNGEVAKQLFLHDEFNLDDKVDISVERKYLGEVLKFIPKDNTIVLHDGTNTTTDFSKLKFADVTHANIYINDELIMTIIVYDVENDEWMFRWNHNIRLPEKHIYFHSIKWDVDYIKPEIVLMYELLDPIDYHQLPNYRSVIDSLSYYQFVILRLVVGDERINQALISEKKAI